MPAVSGAIRVDSTSVMRKRGAPTLIELMQGQAPSGPQSPSALESARRAAGGEPAARGGPRVVEAKPMPYGGPEGSLSQAGRYIRSVTDGSRVLWFLAAAVLVLAVLIWAFAYSAGKRAGRDELAANLPKQTPPSVVPGPDGVGGGPAVQPQPQPQGPASPPRNAPSSPPPVAPQPQPQAQPPQPPPGPPAGSGTIQKGLNYLVVANAVKADADEAVRYLSGNGVPAVAVPVSPTTYQVIVTAKGYSREQLREPAVQAEQAALVDRVKRLGRQWKAENRKAPTDFAQCYWARQ